MSRLHLDDIPMLDSVDTDWRKVPVIQDDFSSAKHCKSQVTLLKLAVEIQLKIIDQLDLTQPVDVEALKTLCQTCKQLRSIVQDNVRLEKVSRVIFTTKERSSRTLDGKHWATHQSMADTQTIAAILYAMSSDPWFEHVLKHTISHSMAGINSSLSHSWCARK